MDHPKDHSLFGRGLPGSITYIQLSTVIIYDILIGEVKLQDSPTPFVNKTNAGWNVGLFLPKIGLQ